MIKAVIVDDEKKGRETLASLLSKHCEQVLLVGQAGNAVDGFNVISAQNPDLIFLDVEMPGGTGFDMLEMFDAVNFDVVFTTAYGHYAIQAFRYSAFDFLLKPVEVDQLIDVCNRVGAKRGQPKMNTQILTLLENLNKEQPNRKMVIPDLNGLTVVDVEDITRFESDSSYTTVHMRDGAKYVQSKHLKEIENMMTDTHFIRVHRSHIINMNHVKRYVKGEGGYVIMRDGTEVEISRRRKNDLMQWLNKL